MTQYDSFWSQLLNANCMQSPLNKPEELPAQVHATYVSVRRRVMSINNPRRNRQSPVQQFGKSQRAEKMIRLVSKPT